jgi:hypothetical protein
LECGSFHDENENEIPSKVVPFFSSSKTEKRMKAK